MVEVWSGWGVLAIAERFGGNKMGFFSIPYHPWDWYSSLHLDTTDFTIESNQM